MLKLLLVSLSLWSADFSTFDTILKNHLKETQLTGGGYESAFDYEGALKDTQFQKQLDQQKAILAKFDIATLKEKNSAVAFWINAYNFFMIEKIIRSGSQNKKLTVNSVKDMGSLIFPYAVFTKKDFNIGGKKYSLDEMEKGILLGEDYKKRGWKDARIHFAVNCASVGCPPLIPDVYTAEKLDEQLDNNTRKAMKTSRHMHLKNGDIHLTHLFKWYEGDFLEQRESVRAWVKAYVEDDKIQQSVMKSKKIRYIDYDWTLNKPANFK